MRKFTNTEASIVADLVNLNEQINTMSREMRALKKKQDELKAELKPVIAKHGEAHNADHIVTVTTQHRKAYDVKATSFDKFNIAER